jgi:hypothetical protein
MTGVGCMMAAGGPYGSGSGAFQASMSWTGGISVTMSGASGVLPASKGVIGLSMSGGTPPYSANFYVADDASGKISIEASPDGVHNTLGWSGFAVNEIEGCTIHIDCGDSAGGSASLQYPSVGQILTMKRTS